MICSKTINNKYFFLHSVLIFIHSETTLKGADEGKHFSERFSSISSCASWIPFFCLQTMCMWERKENELGSLRRWARNEKNWGVCDWEIAQITKRWASAALEGSLFSLRSIIFHRCCLDFKSLLPIYLLLPLLEYIYCPFVPPVSDDLVSGLEINLSSTAFIPPASRSFLLVSPAVLEG